MLQADLIVVRPLIDLIGCIVLLISFSVDSESAKFFVTLARKPKHKTMKRIFFPFAMLMLSMATMAQTDNENMKRDSDVIDSLRAQSKELTTSLRQMYRTPGSDTRETQEKLNTVREKYMAAVYKFANDYPGTEEGTLKLRMYLSDPQLTPEIEVAERLLALYDNMQDNNNVKIAANILKGMKNKVVGAPVANLTMLTPDDKEINLTDIVGHGQYVLVDFWASWCGPCCAEMPNVKTAYEKYHDKGFEIVGVSFDAKKDAWMSALERLGMTWPQMSDLKGWDCAASVVYNIHAIPFTILFDQDGKVLATGLRGDELQNRLKDIFGE